MYYLVVTALAASLAISEVVHQDTQEVSLLQVKLSTVKAIQNKSADKGVIAHDRTEDMNPDLHHKHTVSLEQQQDCGHMIENQASADPTHFSKFDHGSKSEGLYVNPDVNVAFCLIEKNACTAWSAFFSMVELRTHEILEGAPLKKQTHHVNVSTGHGLAHETFSAEKAQRVFQNPNATRAVFVRDPLERFLSAFLDKCFSKGCDDPFCLMRPETQKGLPITFSQAVSWVLAQDLAKTDGYFKPQAKHCELEKRVSEYNVIGHIKPESLESTASCFLQRAGLEQLNKLSSMPGQRAPFWNRAEKRPPAIEFLKRFYTRDAAQAVYEAFSVDYETFNISRPDWIDSATGEFFDHTEDTSCDQHLYQTEVTERDSWDITALAKWAGFELNH